MNGLEKMDDFFDARSESYDSVHIGGIDGGKESKDVIASFLPQETQRLLDLGVGTGLELEKIFARFPSIQVTGLDISGQMLQRLREKYPDKHLTLVQESYLAFPFEKEAFDAAVSVMSLHHYTHEVKTQLYHRIYQCLTEGGMYVECDYMLAPQQGMDMQKLEDETFAEYERLKQEQGLDSQEYYHFDTPCTVENQKKMLKDAGFIHIRQVWSRGNTIILTARKGD